VQRLSTGSFVGILTFLFLFNKYFSVENKILPEDSQIIEETVKKLSEIREEKHEDTVSRSIKTIFRNSIDQSKSKDTDQTSMHLSINSFCKDHRKSFGCIL
jgi:hypothetical protein